MFVCVCLCVPVFNDMQSCRYDIIIDGMDLTIEQLNDKILVNGLQVMGQLIAYQ